MTACLYKTPAHAVMYTLAKLPTGITKTSDTSAISTLLRQNTTLTLTQQKSQPTPMTTIHTSIAQLQRYMYTSQLQAKPDSICSPPHPRLATSSEEQLNAFCEHVTAFDVLLTIYHYVAYLMGFSLKFNEIKFCTLLMK
jgi:hypothetical protein